MVSTHGNFQFLQILEKGNWSELCDILLPSFGLGAIIGSLRKTSRTILITLAVIASSTTVAAPLAAPGDMGLRRDIQVLADYGAISGPVTTWPLSWDALLADLDRIESDDVAMIGDTGVLGR